MTRDFSRLAVSPPVPHNHRLFGLLSKAGSGLTLVMEPAIVFAVCNSHGAKAWSLEYMEGALAAKVFASEEPVPGNTSKYFVARAQRFAVKIPICYRPQDADDWQEGTTVNVSASGVLFRAAHTLTTPGGLQFTLCLPIVIAGDAGAEIRGHGTIIREVPGAAAAETPLFALSIERYRIVRKKAPKNGSKKDPERV
ncbi:MAG TPA: hypothetical protein VMI06_07035 [Terriglobia bacterium]|nr:hypothetical protein [Terriglobia bacterium]